jgi:hypothetical protein
MQNPSAKLADLEARTDQGRIGFLRAEMAIAFTFTELATTRYEHEPQKAEHYVADAEKAYATLVRFMSEPIHTDHLPLAVHEELRAALKQLRETLDGLRKD